MTTSVYRRLLFSVYAPSVLSSASLQASLVLIPLYVLETGGSAAFAAFLFGVRGIGMLLFDIPAGVAIARLGEKPVLIAGPVIMALSAALFAISTDPWPLIIASVLSGAGFTAWMIARQSYITDTSEPGERGRAIAVMAGIMRIGAIAGPGVAALIAQISGFRVAFLVLALTMAGAAILVSLFARNVKPSRPSHTVSLSHLSGIVKSQARTLTVAGIASIGLQLMRSGRVLLIPLFGHLLGLDVAAIGMIVSLSAIVDAALFVPVGIVMDRFGRKWTGLPCLLLMALSLVLLPVATGYYSLLALSLLSGFANGMGTGLLLTLGSDLAPDGARGEFLGIWRLIGDVGHAGGPMIIGVLANVATLGFAALTVAGIGLVGAGFLYFKVDETLDRRQPA